MAKRTRTQVGGQKSFKKWSTFGEGDYLIGTFVEQGVDRKFQKPTYTFEIKSFEVADPSIHGNKEITIGERLTLNHLTAFEQKMEQIEIGTDVEIVYTGKAPLPTGHAFAGTLAHQVDVFIVEGEETEDEEIDL
jgi:hypothetical protein